MFIIIIIIIITIINISLLPFIQYIVLKTYTETNKRNPSILHILECASAYVRIWQ